MQAGGFRTELRVRTQRAHDDLDRMMSGFDLTERDSLARFLQIQLACFVVLDDCCGHPDLPIFIKDVRADLEVLSVREADVTLDPGDPHPLAMSYILSGSRMGTRVLQRRWAKAHDPQVKAAGAYFNAPYDPTAWRDLCHRLDAIPAQSDLAHRITRDATALFGLFAEACTQINSAQPEA